MKKRITPARAPVIALVLALSLTACNSGNRLSVSQESSERVIPLNDTTENEPDRPDSLQQVFFDLQQNAENGDESWRLNPEEVAHRFAVRTLHFKGTGTLTGPAEKESARVSFRKESGDIAEVKFILGMVTQNKKDPDTVEYLIDLKENGSKYYRQLYDEYGMPQISTLDLKVTVSLDASGEILPDTVQIFSNVAPKGEEYVPTKAEDFLPKQG